MNCSSGNQCCLISITPLASVFQVTENNDRRGWNPENSHSSPFKPKGVYPILHPCRESEFMTNKATLTLRLEIQKMTEEQEAACAAATGAATGATGSVGAVAALGVPGLGATGITSGLATIGSVLGGGMATGLVVTAAAPVALGAAAYGLYKWFND
jgi:hypothetical protein